MVSLTPRLTGALLVAAAATCWSSGGIIVRLVEASGFAIVFWRSVFMALTVAGFIALRSPRGFLDSIRTAGVPGLISALLLTCAFFAYVLSLKVTQVAHTVVIMSASPLIAALLGWLLLRERLTASTAIAIAAAFAGIGMMFAEDFPSGHLAGDALAFLVALAFGCNIIILRRYHSIDMVPATFLAGVFSAALALLFTGGVAVAPADIALLAAMGVFQLGLGLILFTRGTPRLRAAEAGLLTLLETVLAPIWVWIGIGEKPSTMALVGGGVVLAALLFHAVTSSTSRAQATANPT